MKEGTRKECYFFHMLPSHAPCKNAENTPGSDFIFQTRLLVHSGF